MTKKDGDGGEEGVLQW